VLSVTARCIGVAAAASLFANATLLFALARLRKRAELLAVAREKAVLDLQNLQKAFHQFAPQRVVEEVIKRGVSTSGETREVTVLFADIVEFTAMSETLEPETLVRILNGYFEATCTAVIHHGGHIANFLGDGIMAIFGAPENNPWQSLDAVIAALAMRKAVGKYNEQLARESLPTLDVRIGVHKGTVVAGVVGSPENVEYTVIGDVVNTAARIENLTRKHAVDILISAAVRPALDGRFQLRQLPSEYVKGKAEPIITFAVEAFRGELGDLD
jgi:class 3 adenylate cyclase